MPTTVAESCGTRCSCCREQLKKPRFIRYLNRQPHCMECFNELRHGIIPPPWRMRLMRDDSPTDLNALVAACSRPKLGLLT